MSYLNFKATLLLIISTSCTYLLVFIICMSTIYVHVFLMYVHQCLSLKQCWITLIETRPHLYFCVCLYKNSVCYVWTSAFTTFNRV